VASLLKTCGPLAATRGCSLDIGRQAAGTSRRNSVWHSAPRVQLSRWAGSPTRLYYRRSVGGRASPATGVPGLPSCPRATRRATGQARGNRSGWPARLFQAQSEQVALWRRPMYRPERHASAPIPKFASAWGLLGSELRNRRTLGNSMILVPL
jgi:hypothetical protein